MPIENIIYFLKTGQLANFIFGTRQEVIIKALGETTWTIPISNKDKRYAVIKYDQVEFYFNHNEIQSLYGIQITYSQAGEAKNLNLEYNGLNKALSYSNIKVFLKDNNILFFEKKSEYDISDTIIETEGQVIFHFNDDNQVQKIGRFVK